VWSSAENIASPPGFDSRTVQPVASRYREANPNSSVVQAKNCVLNTQSEFVTFTLKNGEQNYVQVVSDETHDADRGVVSCPVEM
jgi:hypothetical protein